MQWHTEWWGIKILADSEEDEKILNELLKVLPMNATENYTNWDQLETEFNDKGRLTVIFNR